MFDVVNNNTGYGSRVYEAPPKQGRLGKKRAVKKIAADESKVPASSPIGPVRTKPIKKRAIAPVELFGAEVLSTTSPSDSLDQTTRKVNRQFKVIRSDYPTFTSKYVGQVDEFGRYEGKGTFETSLGSKMEGEWKAGQFIGGEISRNGVVSYRGQYQDGYHGEGVLYLNGTTFEGKFKNKKFISGTRTDPDGTTHTGKFKNFELVEESKNLPGVAEQERTTRSGKRIDAPKPKKFSKRTLNDDTEITLESLEGKNGKGKAFFSNGDRYEGEFLLIRNERIELHGHGIYTSRKGNSLEADFQNGYKIDGERLIPPSAWKFYL